MLSTVFVILALVALIVGSLTDLDRREVPDWLNYFVLIVAIGARVLESIITVTFEPILFGIIGLGVAYAFSALMYYTGQWGGGDAKMLIALGALFGSYSPILFNPIFSETILPTFLQGFNILFMPILIFNILLIGSVYGLVWMSVLAIKYRKKFTKTYMNLWNADKRYMYVSLFALILIPIGFFLDSYNGLSLMILGLALLSFGPALIFGRAIEQACMVQKMQVSDLTEGEWIVKDVWIKSNKENLSNYIKFHVKEYMAEIKKSDFYLFKSRFIKDLEGKTKTKLYKKFVSKILYHIAFDNAKIIQKIQYGLRLTDVNHLISILNARNEIELKKIALEKNLNLKKTHDVIKHYGFNFNQTRLCGSADLGVTDKQISRLKKLKISSVTVKIGIPFIPAFLGGFVVTIIWGNLIEIMLLGLF